jgi:hypothetical protein
MPAGDPAGYLPSVIKKRLKRVGAKPYKVRGKRTKGKVPVGYATRPKRP